MRCLVLAPLLGSLVAIGSAGCAGASLGDANVDDGDGDEGEPVGEPPVGGDLRERLATPTSFVVADQLGGSSASLMGVALSDGQTAAVELAVVGGLVTLSLDPDDRVVFHELVEHGVVDLAPIRLSELAFDVSVESDGSGRLAARLSASAPGVFWSWAGIFELHDLEIELVAAVEP